MNDVRAVVPTGLTTAEALKRLGNGGPNAIVDVAGQAVLYVVRERRHLWSSWPGKWLMASSTVDLAIVSILAIGGILMAPLPIGIVAGVFGAAVVLAFVLDAAKLALFRRFEVE